MNLIILINFDQNNIMDQKGKSNQFIFFYYPNPVL